MAKTVIHVSKADAESNFAALLERVSQGAEVVIESDARPVAVLRSADSQPGRLLSESIGLLSEDSTAVIDPDFAKDVEAGIESHREPLNPPAWTNSGLQRSRRSGTPGQKCAANAVNYFFQDR